ncbi:MAG: TetR/AcrR family transcriptional regulator [Chitinophagaceae bacterium]|jgi:AcrR family transcriptional regulator|nr:TetR/AcrR family transcriptional regulator [Chitinophagaceae bacterium]
MAVEDKRIRERELMRRLILDAAKEIFLEKGYHNTSIRNIAEKIDYSAGTIYLYFKEKDDIFLALHNEAFAKLFKFISPLEQVTDPFERLKGLGHYYLRFALENKDLYNLMFIMSAPMNMIKEAHGWSMGNRVFESLICTLESCKATGRFAGNRLIPLAFLLWSSLHGMCALFCRGRMGVLGEGENDEEVIKQAYGYYLEMIDKM